MALIKDTAELKLILGGIQKNMNFATIEPYLQAAELKYLLPVIGPEQMALLAAQTISAPSHEIELLSFVKRAAAYYGLLESMPFMNLATGDAGLHETSTQNTSPARQWNYNNLETAASNNGDAFLDLALAFLEKNAGLFTAWKESPTYTVTHDLFINHTADMAKYVNIGQSRRAFLMLRPYLERAEMIYILPTLGSAFYDQLKAALAASPSVVQLAAIKRLKGACAHLAFYEAIPEISLHVTGAGIRILNENDSIKSRMQARPTDLGILRESALANGKMYLAEAKKFIDSKAETDYPTYYNSPAFIKPTDQKESRAALPRNDNSTSFFVG
jgi:hypothetical protein